MSDALSKYLEFLRRAHGLDQEPELAKETEWSYVYKIGAKSYSHVSKFLLVENFCVEASTIRERWPSMSDTERLEFVQNFWHKRNWDDNDTQILEVIMADGSDRLWESCAQAFLKHPDHERAVRFLIERLEKCEPAHEPLNYIQVLGLSKDPRAIPSIRRYFEKYSEHMKTEKLVGVPSDVVFGPIPYSQYFVVCEALLKITGATEYDDAIRKYLDHENEQVRWWAEHSLGIEGPTTAKRTAERWKGGGNSET